MSLKSRTIKELTRRLYFGSGEEVQWPSPNEPFVATLAEADIDSLPDKQLRELSKAGSELEPNLTRLRTVVAAGRRLLVRQNIQQLSPFATSRAEEKLFDLFLRDLPN